MGISNQLSDYSLNWINLFNLEKESILTELSDYLDSIHHIGSTSIPGLKAKPEIDLLIIISSLSNIDIVNTGMAKLGYKVRGECGIPGRFYYSKNTNGIRTHKAHVCQKDHENTWKQLAFRDYLISHPSKALEYCSLKEKLMAENTNGITEYLSGKDQFIFDILSLAEQERYEPLL